MYFLGKENPYYYSNYKILATFRKFSDLSNDFVELFRQKFDPTRDSKNRDKIYQEKKQAFFSGMRDQIMDELERKIFTTSIFFLDHVLLTNYYMQTKTGLAFRLSPEILDEKFYPVSF